MIYCVIGCNNGLRFYMETIRASIRGKNGQNQPAAPYLVPDSLTNDSLVLQWNSNYNGNVSAINNITYLIQFKIETIYPRSEWSYYKPDEFITSNRVQITGLRSFSKYTFRVAWIILPGNN